MAEREWRLPAFYVTDPGMLYATKGQRTLIAGERSIRIRYGLPSLAPEGRLLRLTLLLLVES